RGDDARLLRRAGRRDGHGALRCRPTRTSREADHEDEDRAGAAPYPTLALALLAGCAGGAPSGAGSEPWQKAGANEQTMAQDSAACRAPARAEALRRYPYR